jgi:hypothetical protein
METSPRRGQIRKGTAIAICLGFLTGLPVWVGTSFGIDFVPRRYHSTQGEQGFVAAMRNWDGYWYTKIAAEGYSYNPDKPSSVAFFPGYPLIAGRAATLTGTDPDFVLPALSNLCLIVALVLLWAYARTETSHDQFASWVLVATTLWPMSLFLRMAYSEALFLCLLVSVLLGIQRRWPVWVISLLAGAATGTRSVGVALLLPQCWDWWRRSTNWREFIVHAAVFGCVSCWGLAAYMVYLHFAFGDAFAFVNTQQHWAVRGALPLPKQVVSLLLLEPVWDVYRADSIASWMRHEHIINPLFSLQFWNPIYFAACTLVVGWGTWKRWLTTPETLVSAGLLLIPYVFQSYRMMMFGHGRFSCVVFPMYLVMGRFLHSCPPPLAAVLCSLAAVLLAFNSALFASWHRVF